MVTEGARMTAETLWQIMESAVYEMRLATSYLAQKRGDEADKWADLESQKRGDKANKGAGPESQKRGDKANKGAGPESQKRGDKAVKDLERVTLKDKGFKEIEAALNKQSVKIAILRDSTTNAHTIAFKGRDLGKIYAGLEKCVKGLNADRKKTPVQEAFAQAAKRAARENMQKAPKEKTLSRGRSR